MAETIEIDNLLPGKTNTRRNGQVKRKTWSATIKQKLHDFKAPAKLFMTSLVFSLVPTVTDMGSDGYLAWSFVHGDHYKKNVPHESYPTVQLCGASVARTISQIRNGSEWSSIQTEYNFICFEKDPIFGGITLGLIFLPGLLYMDYYYRVLCIQFGLHLSDKINLPWFAKLVTVLSLTLLCCCTFPLQIIGIKTACLFTTNKKLNLLSKKASAREGLFESSLQVCFQLYIIFSKEDRQPSDLQLITLAFSLLMILKTSLQDFYLDQPSWSFYEGVKLLPLAVCGSIFKLGTVSIMLSCFRFNVLYILLAILVVWFFIKSLLSILKKTEKMSQIFCQFDYALLSHAIGLKKMTNVIHIRDKNEDIFAKEKYAVTTSKQAKNLFYSNMFWFFIYSAILFTCLLLANCFPSMEFLSFFPIRNSKYVLSNLPLIQIFNINILGLAIWFCGAVSLILIYIQLHTDFSAVPLAQSVPEFTNNHGSTFKEATQLMKLIALKQPLKHNRQVELHSECLELTCTVMHTEGRSNTGVTPLYWACRTGQTDSALLLLQAGASVNNLAMRSDGEQASPLYWAAKNGLNKVVQKLLDMGADVSTVEVKDCANDETGEMIKSKIGERDCMAPLSDLTEEFQDQGGQTFHNATRLMRDIALGIELNSRSEELQASCLDTPCTVVWRDGNTREGVTPLYWACATGQNKTALLIIKAGADVNALTKRSCDGEKLSSLYRAAKLGSIEVVQALLDKEADPNLGDGRPLKDAKTTEIRILIENSNEGIPL